MDYDEDRRVAVIRSINSTDMKDPTQKEVARVPPIPPPKPKINIKSCTNETNKNGETKNMSDVRQAILRGSKNPAGSSCEESCDIPQNNSGVKHQVMEVPRIQINSLTSRCSIISNEERDANLDIIFSDWGSQTVAQKRSNFLPEKDECPRFEPSNKAYRNSLNEPLSSTRCQDSKLDYKMIARETNDQRSRKNEPRSSPLREKKEDDAKDTEYLLPRLEKQSNQILVLAENNPTELKNDIVRNCDVIEEQVPETGHTGNLLKYWKNVESSPENECKEIISARQNDSSSYSDEEKVTHETAPRDKEQGKSTSAELTHEQVLNDILQEFESFNKDILDLKISVGREPAREETHELQNRDYGDETQYVMSKYDFLATETAKENENMDTTPSADPPTQEEGVYYELDAGEGLTEELAKLAGPAQESISKDGPGNKVTLIAFRKLNKESEVSNRSSPSVSYIEGTNNSILKSGEATSQEEEKPARKKSSSKQKCMVM